jgi:ABC-type polysaccharide/polyol phosphate transport system ATPase subunit
MTKSKKDTVVRVEHLRKTFVIPHESYNSLKHSVLNIFRPKRFTRFDALENINFSVERGEFFGIVGRNGSGKSTLLKLLAQIYVPTHGNIHINGRLSPFIELGVGFNMELTGRENVYLNGAILGLSRKEIDRIFDDIVEFAELKEFIDQRLKNYSSGMQVRLAFSIAIRASKGILLIDEVLAVGDSAFQKKCFDKFYELKRDPDNTIIFVTHDMSAVKRFCDRVLIIDKGRQIAITDPEEAEMIYNDLNAMDQPAVQTTGYNKRWGTHKATIKTVDFINPKNPKGGYAHTGRPLQIKISFGDSDLPPDTPLFIGLAFYSQSGTKIAGPNSQDVDITLGAGSVTYTIDRLTLAGGPHEVTVALFNKNTLEEYDVFDRGFRMEVKGADSIYGETVFDGTWSAE